MRFILAPLIIALGILMMKYTVQITDYTGKLDFAEEYLGKGTAAGTYTWWRLVGLFFVILAALWLFGMMNLVGNGLAGVLGVK
jgi:hypothetical protein